MYMLYTLILGNICSDLYGGISQLCTLTSLRCTQVNKNINFTIRVNVSIATVHVHVYTCTEVPQTKKKHTLYIAILENITVTEAR